MTDNAELDDLLHTMDQNDPAVRVLLDEAMKDAVLHQAAGVGYRKQTPNALTRGSEKGKYEMKPDAALDYSPKEQAALDILSLRKELDFIMSGGVDVPRDQSDPFFQRIARHNDRAIKTASITDIAEGGIKGIKGRADHPDLPPQTLGNAKLATNFQIYDNLHGNPRQEEAITQPDKNNVRGGLPVEHLAPFTGNEALGRDAYNRMLGSQSKNSVLRNEENPARQVVLLQSNLAQKVDDFANQYGESIQDYMGANNWDYKVGIPVMPDF